MKRIHNPLSLEVAQNLTGHLQLLQTLAGRDGYRFWVGGLLPPAKLAGLAQKFAERYPILAGNNRRAYDTKNGRASVRFLAFPDGDMVAWWLVSTEGKGGLADSTSIDFKSARDATRTDSHITCGDYVLVHATKLSPRVVKGKKIVKNVSTWTWKMKPEVYNGACALIEQFAKNLEYGDEGDEETGRRAYGLRHYLALQRRRPLAAGVRNQVIELHRHADSVWGNVRKQWIGRHTELAKKYGKSAGALRPLNQVIHNHLPLMVRIKVYGDAPRTIGDLLATAPVAPAAVPAKVGPGLAA